MFVSHLEHLHVRAEKAEEDVKGNDELIRGKNREFGEAVLFYEADACGDCDIDTET